MFDSVNPSSPFHNVPMDGSFTLYPGQSIYSPNKKQELEMQRDGNLVNYKRNDDGSREVLWASNTAGYPGAYAWFQGDANLVVYSPGGKVRWAARDISTEFNEQSTGVGCELTFQYVGVGGYFALPDEGKMYFVVVPTLYYANTLASDEQFVWTYKKDEKYFGTQFVIFPYYKVPMDGSFTLHPGQSIYSPNKKQELEMQRDGNLVHYKLNEDGSQGKVFWASNTSGNDGAYAAFQGDGNLVVYSPDPNRKVLYGVPFEAGVPGEGSSFALPDVGAMYIISPKIIAHNRHNKNKNKFFFCLQDE